MARIASRSQSAGCGGVATLCRLRDAIAAGSLYVSAVAAVRQRRVEGDSVNVVDQDIQCLLCDRLVAEVRRNQLKLNANYGQDARAALTARRCGHCGGRLVGMPVTGHWVEIEPDLRPRRQSRAG
jgi:hypothetical protein